MSATDRAVGPLPPHRLLREFLAPEEHAALLSWALTGEAQLSPSVVIGGGQGNYTNPEHRNSRSLTIRPELGPWHDLLDRRLRDTLPDLFAGAGLKPFDVSRIELELVVYNDGERFRRHSDTLRAGVSVKGDRLLTAVYYFHAEPKAFSGGALRLYRFGASGDAAGSFVDVEPEQNALLVFPSWATHEVREVSCPSRRYRDSRFAMNCWLLRPRSGAG